MPREIRQFNISADAAELSHSDKRLGELLKMILDERAEFGNPENHEPFKSGKWKISNYHSRNVLAMDYEDNKVVFVFQIKENEKQIDFTNSHRESAGRGKGSEALRALEVSLQELANKKKKPIVVKFFTGGQEDTQGWLEKFSYTEDPREVEGVYGPESWSKIISPEQTENDD